MKGRKCIGLLILCITCLLSLNLFSNASAIRKNIYGMNITHTSYQTVYPNGTVTDLQLNNQWHPLTTVDIPANGVFRINRLALKFGADYNVKKDKKFETEITYYTSVLKTTGLGNATYLNNALCPAGSGGWVIDECSTTIETMDSATDLIYTPGLNQTIGDAAQLDIQSHIITKYVIKMKGHWKNNDTTLRYFETVGASLSIYNTTPISSGTGVWYSFNVPVFNFFDEEESAEDEAAQKELEDRDNLESQSTTTDNQADSAGQSAESTGTTLFAAFSQFFTALTNVNGSSCVLPNMQVYSLNLGQMDLCTYDIPPQIMALVSIGMVFIIVPLGIHLVKRMLSLYKEITG